jgi:hypothetical protein
MISGIAAAMILPKLLPEVSPLNTFPIILLLSGAASVIVSLLTRPEDMVVLKEFYLRTRPWGFWGPVVDAIRSDGTDFEPNRLFMRDAVNVLVGIVWQLSLCVLAIYVVIKHWRGTVWSMIVLIATSVFLRINWYAKLEDDTVNRPDG